MKNNKIKLYTEILAIIAIILISFVGIYKQNENRMKNQIKDYQLSKDLDGYREVVLEVKSEEIGSEDETKSNENTAETQVENENNENDSKVQEENKESKEEGSSNNYENYVSSKKIIEKRLELLGVQDYTISQNTDNGSIYLQLQENSETNYIISNFLQIGKFEIKDSEDDSKVFIDNSELKNVITAYNKTTDGTTVFITFEFNKNGKKLLKEMSTGEYKTLEEESNTDSDSSDDDDDNVKAKVETNSSEDVEVKTSTEETESEDNKETQKKIKLSIDGTELITTSFDDPIENGKIYLSMNKATTDSTKISDTLKSSSTMSSILNSGKMPLTYEIKQNSYIQRDINKNQINIIFSILGVIFAVALLVLIKRYNIRGVIAIVANIGFLALYLLVIRYTNVVVSLESIFTGAVVLVINYLLVNDFLKMQNNTKLINVFKSQCMKILPIIIIAIVFSFIKVTKLATCGMFLFWGIFVSFIYNYILTRDMVNRKDVDINEK